MKRILLISTALPSLLLYMTQSFAETEKKAEYQISVNALAKPLTLGERWGKKSTKLTKTRSFNQTSGDATKVKKISLRFFDSNDCTGPILGSQFDTSGGEIDTNPMFGLVATAVSNVVDNLNISSPNSVAIILKSQTSTVPQAAFQAQTKSFDCVRIDCSGGSCTNLGGGANAQYHLNDTAAAGDPAEGGRIVTVTPAGLIAQNEDLTNTVPPFAPYGGKGTNIPGAQTTSGTTNTAAIDAAINTSNAIDCLNKQQPGGYNTWMLPSIDQLEEIWTNRVAIGNFAPDGSTNYYWSSNNIDADNARGGIFDSTWSTIPGPKDFGGARTRCAKDFTQ